MCSANEAQRKMEEAEHRTQRLMDRIKPLSALGDMLNRNLSDIRELINQARRQAASVHTHTHTASPISNTISLNRIVNVSDDDDVIR